MRTQGREDFDFETLQLPVELGSLEIDVTEDEVARLREAVEYPYPEASHFASSLRAPAILVDRRFQGPLHHLNAGVDIEYFGHARPGTFEASALISEKYMRRGKSYVVVAAELKSASGGLVERSRGYRMVTMSQGIKKWAGGERKVGGKEQEYGSEGEGAGDFVESISKHVTLDKINKFEHAFSIVAAKGPNFHSDPKAARAAGLQEQIGSGHMLLAYSNELVDRALGREWVEGGQLSLRFLHRFVAGDTLTLSAYSSLGDPDVGPAVRIVAQNQAGKRVVAGRAQSGRHS